MTSMSLIMAVVLTTIIHYTLITPPTNATGVGATFTINWGDGSSVQTVTTDNAAGGAGGSAGRLSHQWADGTSSGTSTDNVTLTITNHTTTDPSEIPKIHINSNQGLSRRCCCSC